MQTRASSSQLGPRSTTPGSKFALDCEIGWPADATEALREPKAYAHSLLEIAREYRRGTTKKRINSLFFWASFFVFEINCACLAFVFVFGISYSSQELRFSFLELPILVNPNRFRFLNSFSVLICHLPSTPHLARTCRPSH